MRGQKILEKKYMPLVRMKGQKTTEEQSVCGRNAELLELRNKHIIYRYHYYSEHTDKRWDLIIKVLAKEFYLSEYTIRRTLQQNNDLRRKILQENPSLEKLRRKYYFFRW